LKQHVIALRHWSRKSAYKVEELQFFNLVKTSLIFCYLLFSILKTNNQYLYGGKYTE